MAEDQDEEESEEAVREELRSLKISLLEVQEVTFILTWTNCLHLLQRASRNERLAAEAERSAAALRGELSSVQRQASTLPELKVSPERGFRYVLLTSL